MIVADFIFDEYVYEKIANDSMLRHMIKSDAKDNILLAMKEISWLAWLAADPDNQSYQRFENWWYEQHEKNII